MLAALATTLAVTAPCLTQAATTDAAVPDAFRWHALVLFNALVTLILVGTWVTARRARSAAEFYQAAGDLSGLRNAWAIAGDYLSAASFLGIAGLVSLWGYDGFLYSLGWLSAYVAALLLIARPCRRVGAFTFADILALRVDTRIAHAAGAVSLLVVSSFYLVALLVIGAVLLRIVIGIDYGTGVLIAGGVVLIYVLVGGMAATTRIQIMKAALLLGTAVTMAALLWSRYGLPGSGFFAAVADDSGIQARIAALASATGAATADGSGMRFLEPGLLFTSPLDSISLALALTLGTAGMPHILMRYFTSPRLATANISAAWALLIIGCFYALMLFLGLGATMAVGAGVILDADRGGNAAIPLLARALTGGAGSLAGNLMLAFVAALMFATAVTVAAALLQTITAAFARSAITPGGGSDWGRLQRMLIVPVVGFLIVLAILAEGQNIAQLVALAFSIAASSCFPCIVLALFWKRCSSAGIIAGMVVGTFAALALMLISPNMAYPEAARTAARQIIADAPLQLAQIEAELASADAARIETAKKERAALGRRVARAREELAQLRDRKASLIGLAAPLIELRHPALLSVPLGFLAVLLVSLCQHDPRTATTWNDLQQRMRRRDSDNVRQAHRSGTRGL